jgi:hypothetical protein
VRATQSKLLISSYVRNPQHITQGSLSALHLYVEIKVEEELSNSESKHDNEDEDIYMTVRLNSLNTFITIFKTTIRALKKEVVEIGGYSGRKHYHHN